MQKQNGLTDICTSRLETLYILQQPLLFLTDHVFDLFILELYFNWYQGNSQKVSFIYSAFSVPNSPKIQKLEFQKVPNLEVLNYSQILYHFALLDLNLRFHKLIQVGNPVRIFQKKSSHENSTAELFLFSQKKMYSFYVQIMTVGSQPNTKFTLLTFYTSNF